jgi:hypothetical protein
LAIASTSVPEPVSKKMLGLKQSTGLPFMKNRSYGAWLFANRIYAFEEIRTYKVSDIKNF